MASSEKLMLYIIKLELHEWITTISRFLFPVPRSPPANTPRSQRDTQKEEGYKGSESEREVFARLTVLDSFQGFLPVAMEIWKIDPAV